MPKAYTTQLLISKMFTKLVILNSILALCCAQYPYYERNNSLSDIYKFNRIIGGTNAARAEFPHQVSLQWGYPPYVSFSHMCGGSILNENWILTAAHCVTNLPKNGQFIVRAGKHLIKSKETTEQASYVGKIFVHRQYRGDVSPYDIAILRLTTELKFDNYVKPIALPTPNVIPDGMSILSGWGSISKTTTPYLPDILQKVTLPLININRCRAAMRMLGERGEIHETNLCTGPLTGGYSACSGDSGGPLIMQNENGTSELIGIVSWGIVPCGAFGAPAVFVRVSAFIDWIQNVMNTYNY